MGDDLKIDYWNPITKKEIIDAIYQLKKRVDELEEQIKKIQDEKE